MAARRQKKRSSGELREQKFDSHYYKALSILVDKLFDQAAKRQWTWEQMAEESGLASSTIHNLGARVTKHPQYRTVELLARALGGKIDFVKGEIGKRSKPAWTLKIFGGRRKKQEGQRQKVA